MMGVQPLEWRPTLRVYQRPNLTYLSAMVKESGETGALFSLKDPWPL